MYKVLPLSLEYQVGVLLGRCESYLLSCPPSMRSLVLSDQYSLPALRSACIKYAKETPVSKLRQEAQYNEVVPSTLIDILTYKVDRDEPHLRRYMPADARFRPTMEKISAKLNSVKRGPKVCSGRFEQHTVGYMPGCSECKKAVRPDRGYYCTNPPMVKKHCEGEEDECPSCKTFNLSPIREAVKELAPDPPIVCNKCGTKNIV